MFYSFADNGGSFPQPLCEAEEARCIQMFQTGTPEEKKQAKDLLITHNLRLVAHVAKGYGIKDNEDLISIGSIGLIKGIASYNPERGVKLATYASRCIHNEILMHLRAIKKFSSDAYLNDPIGMDKEGNQITLQDKLSDEGYTIDEQIELSTQIGLLAVAIDALDKRERDILNKRYGLDGGEEATQREIAMRLNISRSYVYNIAYYKWMELIATIHFLFIVS